MADPISELMFLVLLQADVFCILFFFLEIKGQNFAHIILPGIAVFINLGLSTACDTGVLVGSDVYTYPFWGMMFQGAMWLFIGLTLYNFAQETMGKMRKDKDKDKGGNPKP